MNPTDRQIDRTLHLLGSAAPRAGMDQRLLARLENRAVAPVSPWNRMLIFAPPVAALLTVALLVVVFHHAQHPTAPTITQAIHHGVTAANQATAQRGQPSVISAAHNGLRLIPSTSIATNSAEIDPAYLPSFPAPPAPLTADERRLLRLARHASTYDVAQLEAPSQDAISQYIHRMLAPLVAAESLNPTPPVSSDPLAQPPPESQPEPDSNSSPQ